jgi:hypothetical protein
MLRTLLVILTIVITTAACDIEIFEPETEKALECLGLAMNNVKCDTTRPAR